MKDQKFHIPGNTPDDAIKLVESVVAALCESALAQVKSCTSEADFLDSVQQLIDATVEATPSEQRGPAIFGFLVASLMLNCMKHTLRASNEMAHGKDVWGPGVQDALAKRFKDKMEHGLSVLRDPATVEKIKASARSAAEKTH